jgi:hypothetical protein
MFTKINIIIHKASYKYINYVVDNIIYCIEKTTGITPDVAMCESISGFDRCGNSLVFVIGDFFLEFDREPGSFYVFINFSLLFSLRPYRFLLNGSRKWINDKRKLFEKRIKCFDMVIDFYSPQTELLDKKYGDKITVDYFLPSVQFERESTNVDSGKEWDICFVGTMSPRRVKIAQQLSKVGCSVSPFETDDIDNIIVKSRIALNVHYVACDTLEFPRIVHAFGRKTCLVTETCYKLEEFFPGNTYVSADYKNLVDSVVKLLKNSDMQDEVSNNAFQYVNTIYKHNVEQQWLRIFEAIKRKI